MAQINRIGPDPYQQNPMDTIAKALGIASTVYGIKEASAKADALNAETDARQQTLENSKNNVLSNEKLAEFAKNYKVSDQQAPGSIQFNTKNPDGSLKPIYLTPVMGDVNALKTQSEIQKNLIETQKLIQEMQQNKGQTQGRKTADETFGKEYADWNASGGYAAVDKQLNQLESVARELQDPKNNFTGTGKGLLDIAGVRAFTNPEAVNAKQKVLQATQASLRATLGPQFTEREGQKIEQRMWNDNLSPQQNAENIMAQVNLLRQQAAAKDEASKYFEKNGTLNGFMPATNRQALASREQPQPAQQTAAQPPAAAQGLSLQDLLNEKIRRQGIGGAIKGKSK